MQKVDFEVIQEATGENAPELGDFFGTLADLRSIIDKLIVTYGDDAYVRYEAGHNNITADVVSKKAIDEVLLQKEQKAKAAKAKVELKELKEYQRLCKKFGGI